LKIQDWIWIAKYDSPLISAAQKGTRQSALQVGSVGCTLKQAGGLHIKLGCRKRCAALFCRPPLPFPQPADPPFGAVLCGYWNL